MLNPVLASVLTRPEHVELRAFTLPEVTGDAGLLRVEAAGVCGSDVRNYRSPGPPRILGHENVGRVHAIGRTAARRWGVSEGDRIVLEEYLPCGRCPTCRTTEFRLCPASDPTVGGIRYGSTAVSQPPGLWGGFGHYLYLHPNSVLHRAPDGVPAHLLALTLPLSNGFQWAVLDGNARPGSTVLIIGPGQQGLACTLAAKLAGADRIVVLGLARDADRLAVATRLGADHTVAAEPGVDAELIRQHALSGMADLVIDTASGGTGTIAAAAEALTPGGTLLLSTAPDRVHDIPMRALQWKCLTVRGVRGHSYAAVEWAMRTLATTGYPVHALSTHVFGLSEVPLAIAATAGDPAVRGIHATVDPWRDAGRCAPATARSSAPEPATATDGGSRERQ